MSVQASEETTGRQFAMKRMTKTAALQCPEHVFCEQVGWGGDINSMSNEHPI
jgi:hypothetical protein